MKKPYWILLIIFSAVLLLVTMLYIGGIFFIRHRAFSKLSPEERAEYDTYVTKRWTFAEEDIFPDPFEKETVQAARDYVDIYEKHETEADQSRQDFENFQKQEKGEALAPGETAPTMDEIGKQVEALTPILDAWMRMIQKPDYDMEVLAMTFDPGTQKYIPVLQIFTVQKPAKICKVRMKWLNAQGKQDEALELVEAFIPGIQSHTHAHLITNLVHIGCKELLIPEWHDAVAGCDDVERLRRTLQAQKNAIPSDDLVTTGTGMLVRDMIGNVRLASRSGYRDAGIQGKTALQLYSYTQTVLVANYLEKVILPHLDPVDRPDMEMRIEGWRSAQGSLFLSGNNSLDDFFGILLKPLAAPVLYAIALPNWEEARNRLLKNKKSFDLLRIHTAARIYQLETGKLPDKLEDLVPQYLDSIPTDRLNPGKPYPDGEWKQFFEKEE